MPNKTIIYVTANTEPPLMMKMVQGIIRQAGLPVISVSQEPMDFGTNICIGKVGRSGFNVHRQIVIGCERAKTKYIVWCEADTLYPPEHFNFTPPEDNKVYFNKNVWRLLAKRKVYVKKKSPPIGVIVSAREHLLNSINDMCAGLPEWVDKIEHKGGDKMPMNRIRDYGCGYFKTKQPVVSIFHDSGMHKMLSAVTGRYRGTLDYWPSAKQITEEMNI